MDQLGAQDAQYLFLEEAGGVANISGVYVFDQSTAPDGGVVRFREVVERLSQRIEAAPLLKRKLMRVPFELDYPYWVEDPHFEIEYHVRHARLPKPSDWRQFCIHVARFHSRPLDLGRPLWEAYVVEGLENVAGLPKSAFSLIWKAHHAMMDGASSVQLMNAMMDLSPDGPPAFVFPPQRKKAARNPSFPEMIARAAFNHARAPAEMARAVVKSSPMIGRSLAGAARSGLRKPVGVPHTPFNMPVSRHRAFDAAELSLAEVKAVRAAYPEATINDILLAIVSGGLRRYLADKNALPEASLITISPINMRPKEAFSGKGELKNDITAMSLPLYTDIAHPIERLKAIVRSTRKAKAGKTGLATRLMADLTQHLPPTAMALASRALLQIVENRAPMSNLIVSNVPGGKDALYFCGARMTSAYGMAPLGRNMGLFVTVGSYLDKVPIAVTTTREIVPDTPALMKAFRESFEELKQAAEKRLKSGAAKPPAVLKKLKTRAAAQEAPSGDERPAGEAAHPLTPH